jgi:hypothetical protein
VKLLQELVSQRMFSTSAIERPLRLLLIDATGNSEGWEWDVSDRLMTVLGKRGLVLAEDQVIAITSASDLVAHAPSLGAASCVLLFCPGDNVDVWHWLRTNVNGPKLAVVCQWGDHAGLVAEAVLKGPDAWAPIAVAPDSAVAPREGALFLLKFLTELNLHSDDRMTGRMAWFAWTKANELLRRRRMTARFGLRT